MGRLYGLTITGHLFMVLTKQEGLLVSSTVALVGYSGSAAYSEFREGNSHHIL